MTMRRTTCPQCRKKLGAGERIHPDCVDAWADTQAAKAERAQAKAVKTAAKEDRAETKRRKEAGKPLRVLLAEAQTEFNRYVRLRDEGLPCVSCGEANPQQLSGGQWDAGHFLGRGAYPEKRFMEDNVWRQCKACNGGSAKNGALALTVTQRYEAELRNRIGQDRLDAVKAPLPVRKWGHDELREIRETYKAKAKALEKERFC